MKRAVLFLLLLGISAAAQTPHFERMTTPSGGQAICAHCGAPQNPPSRITIAPKGEPGEPMVIGGTVFKADGRTQAENITILVYHTDAEGYYSRPNNVFQPRLYGYMKTGKDGRYEFRTIKPGRYPDHSEPAHIHVHVFGDNYPERFLPEYWFEGDPGLKKEDIAKEREAGDFSAIVHLERGADGVLRGVRNLRLP